MAQQLEPLNLRITGNADGLSAALGRSQQQVSGYANGISDAASKITSKLAAIGSFVLPAGLLGSAGIGVKLAADAEDAELTFKALAGSATEAKRVLADLQAFSASTPFEFTKDVKPAAQQLLTYGFTVEELQKELKILGNVAAVSGADFADLAQLVGRARSTNLLMTDDLNQLSDRAIPILDQLAKRFRVTSAEVRKLASEGKVNFGDLQAVLEALGGEGGQFGTAMEERSRTLTGQISTLKDSIGLTAQGIGEGLLPVANKLVGTLASLVEWVRNLDSETVQTSVEIVALTAGFAAAALVIPKIISLAAGLVRTISAIGKASAITQALSGPAGWATLAAGLALAAGSVYAVDQLFDGLREKQRAVAETASEVSDGFREIEKRAVETKGAVDELRKAEESWQKQAATIRDSLATPIERYEKTIENLTLAVTQGGLEFEFFARGVRKAYDELQNANGAGGQLKVTLKGSVEDLAKSDKPKAESEVTNELATRLADLRKRLQQESENNARAMAESAAAAADLNVATLEKKLKESEAKLKAAQSAIDAKQKSNGVGLFGDTEEVRTVLNPKHDLFKDRSEAARVLDSVQKQLLLAQQEQARLAQAKEASIEGKIDETNRLLTQLNSNLSQPKIEYEPPPVNL